MKFNDMENNRETKKRAVRTLLMSGERFTAIEINMRCFTGDARKCISVLRRSGMNIKDEVIDNNGTKEYWYDGKDE